MYTDPSQIRQHNVKLSFNDLENDLIQAWVNYTGGQKASLIRELVLEQARLDLGIDSNGQPLGNEGPQLSLLRNG